MARSVLSPLRALPWGEGMARSGNVSFYVLQQKCCDPNKLRSRAIRVVAFFFCLQIARALTWDRNQPKGIDPPCVDDGPSRVVPLFTISKSTEFSRQSFSAIRLFNISHGNAGTEGAGLPSHASRVDQT